MTAVKWLESEMLKPNLGMRDILEQAKAMEKEQIKSAYNRGTINGIDYPESTLPLTGKQYYNETFES